jgi:hypothetical protein
MRWRQGKLLAIIAIVLPTEAFSGQLLYSEEVLGRSEYALSNNPPCTSDQVTCQNICIRVPDGVERMEVRSYYSEGLEHHIPEGCADDGGWCAGDNPEQTIGWAAWGGPVTHRHDANGRYVCRVAKNWSRDRDRIFRLEVEIK